MLSEKGQSLLEVVIALAVIIIIVGALTFATISSIRNGQVAKAHAQATKLAQEGIEWVRTGRDRNQCITMASSGASSINSWNGSNSDPNCVNPGANPGSIWQSLSAVFACEQEAPPISKRCYFKILSDGRLTGGNLSDSFPTTSTQYDVPANSIFRRSVMVTDDLNDDKNFSNNTPTTAKKVTVIVRWTDFACGTTPYCHESRLTTILRKL